MRVLKVFTLALLLGCASVQCPITSSDPLAMCADGIPNFRLASSTNGHMIYRGGQPTVAGWSHLQSLGVTTVVKLDDPAIESFGQGDDEPAMSLGMSVVVDTIHPIGDYNPLELFEGPSPEQAAIAVAALATSPGPAYVHCEHGRDRTGLIVALYRVYVDGVTPDVARAEMLAGGFRTINIGLERFWNHMFVDDSPQLRRIRQNEFRLLISQQS